MPTTTELARAVSVLAEDVNEIGKGKIAQFLCHSVETRTEFIDPTVDLTSIDQLAVEVAKLDTKECEQVFGVVCKAIQSNDYAPLTIPVAAMVSQAAAVAVAEESRPHEGPPSMEPATVTTTRSVDTASDRGVKRGSKMHRMQEFMQEMLQDQSQDIEEIEVVASRIHEERFDESFMGALKNGCGNAIKEIIQEMIDTAPPKTDSEKIKLVVDGIIQSAFGQKMKVEVETGDKILLPPLQPVDPFFVKTQIADDIEYNYHMGQHIYLDGPSGCGKTFPVEQILRQMGKRYVKVNFADGIRLSDLTTKQDIIVQEGNTQTIYRDGLLPFVMRNGLAFIGDEVDQLQSETTSIVNPLLDKYPGELVLPGSGERVVAQPGFWVALTGNTLTDETGMYSGYKASNSLTNRCTGLRATYLDKAEEVSILEKDGLNNAESRQIVNVMRKLRKMYIEDGSVSQAPSTRQAVRISRYLQGKDVYGKVNPKLHSMDRNRAWHFAYFNFLPNSEYEKAVQECHTEDSEIMLR